MPDKLSILDLHDQVAVYWTRRASGRETTLSALATGVAASYMAYERLGEQAALAMITAAGAAAAAIAFRGASRQSSAELRASRQELIAEGRNEKGVPFRQRAAMLDVRWLEYRPAAGDAPGGLYAELQEQRVCLIPDVEEGQATEVIERITAKFPELGERWANPFGQDYASPAHWGR